jgi:hypothetical protein
MSKIFMKDGEHQSFYYLNRLLDKAKQVFEVWKTFGGLPVLDAAHCQRVLIDKTHLPELVRKLAGDQIAKQKAENPFLNQKFEIPSQDKIEKMLGDTFRLNVITDRASVLNDSSCPICEVDMLDFDPVTGEPSISDRAKEIIHKAMDLPDTPKNRKIQEIQNMLSTGQSDAEAFLKENKMEYRDPISAFIRRDGSFNYRFYDK